MRKNSLMFIILITLLCSCTNKSKDLWEKINMQTNIFDYQEFLMQFPSGIFADSARLRIHEIIELENAKTINSFHAYYDFIINNPYGPVALKARECIEQLYMNRDSLFLNTKKILVTVKEKYKSIDSCSVIYNGIPGYYKVNAFIDEFLEDYTGLVIVDENSEDYDVVLEIDIIGEVKPHNYSKWVYGPCDQHYTEGYLKGTVTLRIPNNIVREASFNGHKPPAEEIYESYPFPSCDVLNVTLNEFSNFYSILFKVIGEAYGKEILISAKRNQFFVDKTDWALGEIVKQEGK